MKQPGSFLSKSSSYILILIFAVVLFFKYLSNPNNNPASHQNVIPQNAHLIFTKHAKCRMDCRHIDESEISEIIRGGQVNEQKSNPNDEPCPTIAIEGTSHDNQQLRIVFAKCDDEVKVVTCIDLKNDYECDSE